MWQAMCDVYEKGISLAGMSKVYALPGLRVGWLVSPAANGFIDRVAALGSQSVPRSQVWRNGGAD